MFCLLKEQSDAFIEAVKDGRINPERLMQMTSKQRNDYFGTIVGKNHAQAVNSLFESKLLLKNQKAGMVTWAKQVSGIKPAARRDLITRIERLQNVLDPGEQEQFLADLTATRLGVGVSEDEARRIAKLSKKVSELEATRKPGGKFESEQQRMDYGRSVVQLRNYVTDLKKNADRVDMRLFLSNKGEAFSRAAKGTADNARSIKASLDNSAIFRQGWKTMWTNPTLWAKNAARTFSDIAKTVRGKDIIDEVDADIFSRPNYDLMKRAKLAVADVTEEAFPSSLPEKIPAFGRIYKASQDAYTAFLHRQRADIFDKYLEVAKKTGVDISDDNELKAIGKLVNALTGRGHLGKLEPAADTVNSVFFSPRLLKSHIDTLTMHKLQKGATPFVRKQAARNLLKIISGTAAILAVAEAFRPGSVETDARSSDFGKIKIGDTRFDVSGGMGGLIVLANRLKSQQTKSTTTGRISDLNTGEFGSRTTKDVVIDFFTNKLAPAYSVVNTLLEGEDFEGNKPTPSTIVKDLFLPIPIQNYQELKDNPDSANILLAMIADGLGLGSNTYSADTDWSQSTSAELTQFREKIGEAQFKQANDEFNREYKQWLSHVSTNERYKSMSDDDKKLLLNREKQAIKKRIFDNYDFKPERSKKKDLPDL